MPSPNDAVPEFTKYRSLDVRAIDYRDDVTLDCGIIVFDEVVTWGTIAPLGGSVPSSPYDVYSHLKETICSYIETAYKMSNRLVFAERGERLRSAAVVAQEPFIESTPAFPGTEFLKDVVARLPGVPRQLAELAAFGMPVENFPLYTHQVDALEQAFLQGKNLLVTTGTGSGKTEIFLLVALASILREALSWPVPNGSPQPGTYNSARRKSAVRTIVLYRTLL